MQLLKLSILLRAAVQRLLSNTVGAGLQLGPQIVYLPAALVTSACYLAAAFSTGDVNI